MSIKSRRPLRCESLESRTMMAADVALLAGTSALPPDGHDDVQGCFADDVLPNQHELSKGIAAQTKARKDSWPAQIALPEGFEPEGIELGRGHDFFAGAFSFSSFLGPLVGASNPVSPYAGAIYKGDLRTGEGALLVQPTGDPIAGLSYDARTDNLYAAVGDPSVFGQVGTGRGVVIYNGSTGDFIDKIIFTGSTSVNDVLVTKSAVFATDSNEPVIYKIPLEKGGRLPSPLTFQTLDLSGPGVGARDNGLVGDFDGDELVVINDRTGILYRVDTTSGAASPIEIQGDETLFARGDGLYMRGRTLYIMQNFLNKIAVVQLSGDLTEGTFVKNIVSDDFRTPTTITGFGDSIYAINSHVLFPSDPNFDPAESVLFSPGSVQSEIVKVHK